jgi:hypothetical protein
MTIATRFGKKIKVPSTFQIKHQLLLFWLKNQVAKEAAEDKTDEGVASRDRATAEDPIRAMRLTPPLLTRVDEVIE